MRNIISRVIYNHIFKHPFIIFFLKFGDKGKAHRCFKLIDTKDLNIGLDLIQIHILEVKRFIEIIKNPTKEELKNNRLLSWMKFFTSDNLELIEEELKRRKIKL